MADSFMNESIDEGQDSIEERDKPNDLYMGNYEKERVQSIFQEEIYRPASYRINTSSTRISSSPKMSVLQFNNALTTK